MKRWLDGLSGSEATRTGALYAILRYSQFAGADPERLVEQKEKELAKRSPRLRFETEDKVRSFAKNVKGAQVYAAYVKSFFRANHLPLDLKLVRPPPQREPIGIPDDTALREFVNATGSKQMKALALFLLESGARVGSVLRLQYRHVKADFEKGTFPCMVSFPAKITKGGRPYVGFIGEDAVKALRDYLTWRSSDRQIKDAHGRLVVRPGRPVTDDSYLFESRNGRPLSKTTTIQRFGAVAYKAGLNGSRTGLKTFHPHVLRQRAQTVLEGSGVPLNWVDLLLGHTPRGAQGTAYSRPSDAQLRGSYTKAYPDLRIFKPPMSKEDMERLGEMGRLEAQVKEIRELALRAIASLPSKS